MTSTSEFHKMASRLKKVESRLSGLSTPSMIHRTISGGAMPIRSVSGQLTGLVGQLPDGTFGAISVAGPVPPTPAGLTMEQSPIGVIVRWDGSWKPAPFNQFFVPTPAVAPLDFAHVEVHVDTDPGFSGLFFNSKRGEILSARGGELLVPVGPGVEVYARLVTRTAAGRASIPSDLVGPVAGGRVSMDQLDVDPSDFSGTTIFYDEAPEGMKQGDLWLRPPDAVAFRYVLDELGVGSWQIMRDQGIVQALQVAQAAQGLAATKTQTFRQASAPTTTGRTLGDEWIDTDDGNRPYYWTSDGWTSTRLGNGAIQPSSLVARDVIATGTISAGLLEAIMILANIIYAGDPNGEHTKMDRTGLAAYAADPVDGVPDEVARLGRTIGIRNPATGETVALINEQGQASFQALSSVADPVFGGVPLATTLLTKLSGMPVWGGAGNPSARSTGAEVGFWEFQVTLQNNRIYELSTSHMRMNGSVDGQVGAVNIKYTEAAGTSLPPTPTIDSAFLTRTFVQMPYGIAAGAGPIRKLLSTPPGSGFTTYRFLMTNSKIMGSGDVYIDFSNADPIEMWVEDKGPLRDPVVIPNNGGGQATGGAPVEGAPTPVLTKQRSVLEFGNHWTRTFKGNGQFRTDTSDAIQGYESFNGNQLAMIGFGDLTPYLVDADLISVQFYLYCHKWYFKSGGTALIGVHGNLNAPATVSGGTAANVMQIGGWPNAAPKWFDMHPGWIEGFKTGAYRGLLLGPGPNNDPQYYGRFAGAPGNVLIRLTFMK